MALEYLSLLMGNSMRASIIMIKSMVMAFFIGQMENNIKAGGKKENNMVMVY